MNRNEERGGGKSVGSCVDGLQCMPQSTYVVVQVKEGRWAGRQVVLLPFLLLSDLFFHFPSLHFYPSLFSTAFRPCFSSLPSSVRSAAKLTRVVMDVVEHQARVCFLSSSYRLVLIPILAPPPPPPPPPSTLPSPLPILPSLQVQRSWTTSCSSCQPCARSS